MHMDGVALEDVVMEHPDASARHEFAAHRHEWPQWAAQDLSRIFPTLEPEGIDLLKKMLEFDPAKRVSVSASSHVLDQLWS